MGQYWKPIVLADNNKIVGWTNPHNYSDGFNGLKLMEHGYLDNDYVRSVERLFTPGGQFDGYRLVWSGDYAEPEPKGKNLWGMLTKKTEIKKLPANPVDRDEFPFIINLDKNVFIDKRAVIGGSYWSDECRPLHPLVFMTLDRSSLGYGGGDQYEHNASGSSWEDVGSWSRDHIRVDKVAPDGFTEYVFDLSEGAPSA